MKSAGCCLLIPALVALSPPSLADPAVSAGTGRPVPALYPTRAEAEQAARLHFHCAGAHRMGQHWMPCARHSPSPTAPGHAH